MTKESGTAYHLPPIRPPPLRPLSVSLALKIPSAILALARSLPFCYACLPPPTSLPSLLENWYKCEVLISAAFATFAHATARCKASRTHRQIPPFLYRTQYSRLLYYFQRLRGPGCPVYLLMHTMAARGNEIGFVTTSMSTIPVALLYNKHVFLQI